MDRGPGLSFTEHQQRFIASLIESGRYRGVSEVVRAALRLLEEREAKRQETLRQMEAAVEAGLKSGDPVPLEPIDAIIAEAERTEPGP